MKYPEYIMSDLRRSLMKVDGKDKSKDETIMNLDKNRVFAEVVSLPLRCDGFDVKIKKWVRDIYNVDLDTIE